MKPKLTDWYPAETRPIYSGEYDTDFIGATDTPIRAYWYAGLWRWSKDIMQPYGRQNRQWRGLAEKPK